MKRIALICLLTSILLLPALLAQADEATVTPPSGDIKLVNPLGQGATFIAVLNNIFTQALKIVAVIVPVIIVIGAFQMMFAAGSPEKFAKGQKTILFAVIGFVIVLIAKGIVAIVQSLLKV